MSWRADLLAEHGQSPQKAQIVRSALAAIDDAILRLASLGHVAHLAPGKEPPEATFPRRVFHVRQPQGRIVGCEADLIDLGPNWHSTLEAARHEAGLIKQWQRGGFFDRALPSLEVMSDEERMRERARHEAERQAERAAVHERAVRQRARNRRNRVAMPGINGAGK